MSAAKKSRGPRTASELMAKLNQDPEYVRRRQERDHHFGALEQHFKEAESPLVEALNNVVGVSIKSVWDLVKTKREYRSAIPVLVAHLRYEYPYRIREGIARALTVKYAGETAYEALVTEFRKRPGPVDAAEIGFKWALGNAISVAADRSRFDEVVELVIDKRHGGSRDMLALRLPDLARYRAVDVLIELLGDDEVAGHAVVALGKLKAQKARAHIERLTKHANPWVREEASKALARLDA
jgi:hypothetical protein